MKREEKIVWHGRTGPRYDDYTSVAYWYQTLPSAPLMPLPTDAEMCMR